MSPEHEHSSDLDQVTAALERVRGIVRLLRSECGWTSALTPQKRPTPRAEQISVLCSNSTLVWHQ